MTEETQPDSEDLTEGTQEILNIIKEKWESQKQGLSYQIQEADRVQVMPSDARRFSQFEKVAAEAVHQWRGDKNSGFLGRNRKNNYIIIGDRPDNNRSWIEE